MITVDPMDICNNDKKAFKRFLLLNSLSLYCPLSGD